MRVTVRRSRPADLSTIVEYNAAMARETEGLELDREVLTKGVKAVMREPSRGHYLLAEAEGRVLGQTMITFEWSDWRNGNFWWIQSVYVDPAYRRRGVYRQLYRHVLNAAQESGEVRGVRLYVERENSGAREVYTRLGMNRAAYEMYEIDFVMKR